MFALLLLLLLSYRTNVLRVFRFRIKYRRDVPGRWRPRTRRRRERARRTNERRSGTPPSRPRESDERIFFFRYPQNKLSEQVKRVTRLKSARPDELMIYEIKIIPGPVRVLLYPPLTRSFSFPESGYILRSISPVLFPLRVSVSSSLSVSRPTIDSFSRLRS